MKIRGGGGHGIVANEYEVKEFEGGKLPFQLGVHRAVLSAAAIACWKEGR